MLHSIYGIHCFSALDHSARSHHHFKTVWYLLGALFKSIREVELDVGYFVTCTLTVFQRHVDKALGAFGV